MKYPILLVHGVGIKDFKFLKAFGNIENYLKEEGYIVYTSTQDSFGSIENNAKQLKEQINEILSKENVDKINLIAHSKGGLDSKYMIENLDMQDKIASLTTLCTPFKGSIIASMLFKLPSFLKKSIAFIINTAYKIFKDKNPDALKVCEELQKHDHIEIETLQIPHSIYCQSYSTTLKRKRDDFKMGIPLFFSRFYEEESSDGLVSKDSTKFENYKGDCIDDSISHIDIVDFMAKKKKKEKIYGFYHDLCLDLENHGL